MSDHVSNALITAMTDRLRDWMMDEYPEIAVNSAVRLIAVNSLLRVAVAFTTCHSTDPAADLAVMAAFITDSGPVVEAALKLVRETGGVS